MPHPLAEPRRRMQPKAFHYGIDPYGRQQQHRCPREQRSIGAATEQRQQHPHQGVERQDVAAPQEKQVHKANEQQHRHAAIEDAEAIGTTPRGIGNDDRKAHAEQEREQRVELAIDQQIEQPVAPSVERGCRQGGLRLVAEERPQRELGEVGKHNAQQRKASQCIEDDVALPDCDRGTLQRCAVSMLSVVHLPT